MADGNTLPQRGRSLRIRQRVDYSEDEDEEPKKSDEKKRGSKRKAELNIESLYCQENIKDVVPSSLETIFESPRKEQGRGRSRKPNIINSTSNDGMPELHVMGVKKVKRFCSFVSYYYPTKQKTKVRKDRAKKLKQLTGVKVPKGSVSDEALKTALAVLSEDEDQNENIPCNEGFEIMSSSFYIGNVIRPDMEDSSVNEVIRNISSMQMITENSDELIPKDFMEGVDEPLSFDKTERRQSSVSQQKKSRRRSSKFNGCLLPNPLKSTNEETGLASMSQGDISEMNASCMLEDTTKESKDINIYENGFPLEDTTDMQTTPKRRNVVNDRKIVKKVKRQETNLKRQSEAKEEQSQKKRGNLHVQELKIGESCITARNRDESNPSVHFDVENSNVVANTYLGKGNESLNVANTNDSTRSLPQQESVSLHCIQNSQNCIGQSQTKKRGKRRVSGVQRPLYRTIIAPASPEVLKDEIPPPKDCRNGDPPRDELLVEDDHQLVDGSSASLNTKCSTQQLPHKSFHSPTSPCTQMAALTLHSESDTEISRVMGKQMRNSRAKKVTRRRSEQFAKIPITETFTPCNPPESLSSVSYSAAHNGSSTHHLVTCGSTSVSVTLNTASENASLHDGFGGSSKLLSSSQKDAQSCSPLSVHSGNVPVKLEYLKDNMDVRNLLNVCESDALKSKDKLNSVKSSDISLYGNEVLDSSPVITGMIENKAKIRLGKMFCNKFSSN